jgi:preprotein translocase SecE subunit
MATDVMVHGADQGGDRPTPPPPRAATGEGGGFFHIYKKGQGYWTRMGSAGAAAIIALLCIQFLYTHLNVWLYGFFDPGAGAGADAVAHAESMTKVASMVSCGVFLLAFAGLVYWLLNKPDYADFLIATDSEMKKVNWTSRQELMGSTKVVIIFMFLIAFLLFAFDLFFGYLFYFMDVLKSKPL